MPAYVSTSVFANGTSVETAIESLLDLGIENIELSSVHEYDENVLAVVAHFDANFLTHNFFPPAKDRRVLNIASANEKVRQNSIEFIKEAIDFAERMDIKLYTFHPGFLRDPIAEIRSKEKYDFEFSADAAAPTAAEYERSFERFLHAVKEIGNYLQGKEVKVAVETQGSVVRKDMVLFARPEEFKRFYDEIKSEPIGINLNLGHLNLAAKAWGFDKKEAAEKIQDRISAVEVTHNDGSVDDHAPLREDAWYFKVLKDKYFQNVPVIFDGRFTPEPLILRSYDLLKEVVG